VLRDTGTDDTTTTTPPPRLVEVACGVDQYGLRIYRLVPADVAGQWDDRDWRDQPLR
jgi:hypothetical protein